jgi:hypothetical protein
MNTKHLLVVALLGVVLFTSCNKEEILSNEPGTQEMTRLGKQLENPYSVENMRIALENLQNSNDNNRMGDGIEVITTHLYLKFKPQNEDELSLLQQDSTLNLYTYPLDYELLDGVEDYRDPEVLEDQPTYQYCAVPVDKALPDVSYEILEQLFIPDDYSDDGGQRFASEEITDALVDEALRITDNFEPEEYEYHDNERRRRKWRPAGKITVWDDEKRQYIGVHGVKVRARRWFTTRTGIARSTGDYSCNGKFRRKANYSIKWKRYDFTVRKGHSSARYKGPKKKGNWNLNIKGGRQEYYATIFRAAHHYYYKDIKGLRKPPQNSFWRTKLKIRANYKTRDDLVLGDHDPSRRFLGMGSAIHIFSPEQNSKKLYATVIHELAHASHWAMDRWSYFTCENIVAESWARGVERELTRMIYPGYKPWYCTAECAAPYSYYTGVVPDMIDERDGYDRVKGYTIRQIEDALDGETTWNEWKTNIKNSYENETEDKLDALFEYWN